MTGAAPGVSIVVVNRDGRRHLAYCLPSLLASDYDNFEVILVDNGSRDDSVAFARSAFPEVVVIRSDRNRGWAGGNNLGVEYALARGARYVVLQNNDTRVDPRWLRAAVDAMERHPRLGALGFEVLGEYRGDEDVDGRRFAELVAERRPARLTRAGHLTGCALFVRAEVFHDVGLFDERYFVFSEEDDFLARAAAAGYERARLAIPVWHFHGGTWRRHPLRFSLLAVRNDIRCILKTEPPRRAAARLLWLARFVLDPRSRFDPAVSHLARLRPSRWPVNAAILAYAVGWNLVLWPETLAARRRDFARAARARRYVAALPPTPLGGA